MIDGRGWFGEDVSFVGHSLRFTTSGNVGAVVGGQGPAENVM